MINSVFISIYKFTIQHITINLFRDYTFFSSILELLPNNLFDQQIYLKSVIF